MQVEEIDREGAPESVMPDFKVKPDVSSPWLALALLVPVPSIAIILSFWWLPGSKIAENFWLISKLWILILPVVWHIFIAKQRMPKLNFSNKVDNKWGISIGILSMLVIAATYFSVGSDFITSTENLKGVLGDYGLLDIRKFILFALSICFLNALVEEYVWRWFCLHQCKRIFGFGYFGHILAILFSSAFFTIHHFFAIKKFFEFEATVLCCVGVFLAGVSWSLLYKKSGSLIPGYIAHLLADVAVFVLAWVLVN